MADLAQNSLSREPFVIGDVEARPDRSLADSDECRSGKNVPILEPPQDEEPRTWKAAAVAKDVALLSTGAFIASAVNTALVFLVPRILSVEEYGYWRLFGLYAAYVGLLHLGFPDGALVRWAGRDFRSFHHEVQPSTQFVLLQQVAVVIPLCALFAFGFSGELRFVAVAIVLFAIVMNLTVLLQYAFQAARRFHPVAISTIMGPGLFLCLLLLWNKALRQSVDSEKVIVLYSLAWLITLGFLFVKAQSWRSADRNPTRFVKQCTFIGLPIVLANTVACLTLSVDRLTLSWATNIRDFAQYSLAASAMAVPITAIQASSKVLFPHLASLPSENRKRFYGLASRSLLMAWALLLPYDFILDAFVRRVLPRYEPSLEIAKVLLLGIVFIAGIQVLQAAFAFLHGKQVRYLIAATAMLVLGGGAAYLAAFKFRSLKPVAIVEVLILATWWLVNEWDLRNLTLQKTRDWARFMSLFGATSLIYFLAAWLGKCPIASLLIYYACIAALLTVFCRSELAMWNDKLSARWPALSRIPGEARIK